MWHNFWRGVQCVAGAASVGVSWCWRLDLLHLVDRRLYMVLATACGGVIFGIYLMMMPRYRAYSLGKLRVERLGARTRQTWARLTADFALLGYEPVGDYRLAGWPLSRPVRYFVSKDGATRGEIYDDDGRVIPGFATLFDDGRLIASAVDSDQETRCQEQQRLWLLIQRDGNLFDMHNRHQKAVKAYAQETEALAITVTPDRVPELAEYGHRLYWWEKSRSPLFAGAPVAPRAIAAATEELMPTHV